MKWSPCSRRPPRLPRTHEGPLPTLRLLQCSPPLAHALFGASSCLCLLAGVCVLGLHDPLPSLRPAVLADAVIPTDAPPSSVGFVGIASDGRSAGTDPA